MFPQLLRTTDEASSQPLLGGTASVIVQGSTHAPVLWAQSTGLLARGDAAHGDRSSVRQRRVQCLGLPPLPPESLAMGVQSSPSVTGPCVLAPLRHGQAGGTGAVGAFPTLGPSEQRSRQRHTGPEHTARRTVTTTTRSAAQGRDASASALTEPARACERRSLGSGAPCSTCPGPSRGSSAPASAGTATGQWCRGFPSEGRNPRGPLPPRRRRRGGAYPVCTAARPRRAGRSLRPTG